MKKNFAALSGLRAIAAMAVVCFHYCPRLPFGWATALVRTGPAAVGFFFLLSGFVLAFNHREVRSFRTFWVARLIRIYPMYLFAFVIFLPIALIKYHGDPQKFGLSLILNVAMLQSWTNLAQSWNGPSWSLSVEAFLYFAFPLVLTAIVKQKQLFLFVLPVMIPVGLTIAFCNGSIPKELWEDWIANNPIFWLPIFCFGIALGLWRTRHPASKVPVGAALAGAAAALVALVIVWPPEYREVFISGAGVPVLAAIVVLCTYPSRWGDALLANPVAVRLGSASYITYIIQSPLWHYYEALTHGMRHLRWLSGPNAALLFFLVFAAGLCATSVALEAFVDEPLRAWLIRLRYDRTWPVSLSRPD